MSKISIDEIRRKSDMLCTFHSLLKDRYHMRDLTLNMGLWTSSAALCSLTFAPENFLFKYTGYELLKNQSLFIGIFATLNFTCSIMGLLFKWQEKSANHFDSFKYFFEIKSLAKNYIDKGIINAIEEQSIVDKYQQAPNYCLKISEQLFLSLKRTHKIKIVISKQIDHYPFVPLWLWKIIYLVGDLKKLIKA